MWWSLKGLVRELGRQRLTFHDPLRRGLRRASLLAVQRRGDRGEAGSSSRGTRSLPYAPPAEAGLGVAVLRQHRGAEAARIGEGSRGRSLGAPGPPPIPPPARSPLEAGELCGRPIPALPPSLPPSSSLLGPWPRSTSWYFQNCRGQASLCRRGSLCPRPRLGAGPRCSQPTSLPSCAGGAHREGASRTGVWRWGPPGGGVGVGLQAVRPGRCLTPLRGSGTGSKKDPWVPTPAFAILVCWGLSPCQRCKPRIPRSPSVLGRRDGWSFQLCHPSWVTGQSLHVHKLWFSL